MTFIIQIPTLLWDLTSFNSVFVQSHTQSILTPINIETQADPIFDYNFQIEEFFSKEIENFAKEENLCLGKSENTAWNLREDVSEKLLFYFENIRIRHKTDPFWMLDSDPLEVDKKKRILLLTAIEKQSEDPVSFFLSVLGFRDTGS